MLSLARYSYNYKQTIRLSNVGPGGTKKEKKTSTTPLCHEPPVKHHDSKRLAARFLYAISALFPSECNSPKRIKLFEVPPSLKREKSPLPEASVKNTSMKRRI